MTEQNKENQSPDAVPAYLSVGSVEPKYKKGDHVLAKQTKELTGRTGCVVEVDTYRMVYEVTFGTEVWKMLEDDLELVDPAIDHAKVELQLKIAEITKRATQEKFNPLVSQMVQLMNQAFQVGFDAGWECGKYTNYQQED